MIQLQEHLDQTCHRFLETSVAAEKKSLDLQSVREALVGIWQALWQAYTDYRKHSTRWSHRRHPRSSRSAVREMARLCRRQLVNPTDVSKSTRARHNIDLSQAGGCRTKLVQIVVDYSSHVCSIQDSTSLLPTSSLTSLFPTVPNGWRLHKQPMGVEPFNLCGDWR